MTAHTEITGTRVLSVPPHICGRIVATAPLELRRERFRWVQNARATGYNNAQIARLLGISKVAVGDIIANGEPQEQVHWRKASAPVVVAEVLRPNVRMPADTVSLASTPWDADGERPAIRATLVKPVKRRGLTVEGVIAIIRAECLKARAEAEARA